MHKVLEKEDKALPEGAVVPQAAKKRFFLGFGRIPRICAFGLATKKVWILLLGIGVTRLQAAGLAEEFGESFHLKSFATLGKASGI